MPTPADPPTPDPALDPKPSLRGTLAHLGPPPDWEDFTAASTPAPDASMDDLIGEALADLAGGVAPEAVLRGLVDEVRERLDRARPAGAPDASGTIEWGIVRVRTDEVHRAGFTEQEARDWLAEWEDVGGRAGVFAVIRRSLGAWQHMDGRLVTGE